MTISSDLKSEAWASESDLPLMLLVIDHADLATPIRVVNNTVAVTSNSVEYTAYPFELPLPDSLEDAPPRTRLVIDNVSREIAQAIRSISSPPTVSISVVRQDDPDTVEMTFPDFKLRSCQVDALTVSGELELEDFTREPYPAQSFTPSQYPGLA